MSEFTSQEWQNIFAELNANEQSYNLPKRKRGSILLGSFNIRKLGNAENRDENTWKFLAHICKRYDLLSIQETADNMSGLRKLLSLMGKKYSIAVSDATGGFPGDQSMTERLGFIYRNDIVQKTELASDITFDRSKVIEILSRNYDKITSKVIKMRDYYVELDKWINDGKQGSKPKKPKLKMPVFMSFIRQPYCVSFSIPSKTGGEPYQFLAVDAHLYYGSYLSDRKQEFNALMEWLLARVEMSNRTFYPNFILMGDLNLDFDNPKVDRADIEIYMKSFNNKTGDKVNVNFPFLDIHAGEKEVYRTTAREDDTYDQIGLFCSDKRFPTFDQNPALGNSANGPDYGVFNFAELFAKVTMNKTVSKLTKTQRKKFYARFEHKVSDHMPLWLRMPKP